MGRGGDRRMNDLLLRHVVFLEGCDGMPARHHDHSVAETLQLDCVARRNDDGHAAPGDLAQDAIDLGASTDVHALRRLVGDEDCGVREHCAGHHDLLLIAAGESGYRRLERGGADRELREFTFDRLDLPAMADEGTHGEPVERRQGRVLADVQIDHQPLGQPVGGHVGRVLFARTPRQVLVPDPDRARRLVESGQRAEESALTVPDDAGDADDLALVRGERDVVEPSAGQPFDPQHRPFVVMRDGLRRKCRVERPPDDQGEQLVVGDLGNG